MFIAAPKDDNDGLYIEQYEHVKNMTIKNWNRRVVENHEESLCLKKI
jgi:hypothetical protein